jgi:hypothetical protein
MALAPFNIGRQASLGIIVNGVPLVATKLTKFTWKEEVIKLKSRPLASRPVNVNIPDGYSGTLEFDRGNGVLDQYFAQRSAQYWSSGVIDTIQINYTIPDPTTGAIMQLRFEGITLEFASGGDYEQDKIVQQKADWMATDMSVA